MATQELLTQIKRFLEYLEIEKGRSPRTVRNYDFYLKRFADWAEYPALSKISRETIRRYRLWLNRSILGRESKRMKASTQNYHLIALRSFLKYLVKMNIASLAPEQIELSKQPVRQVEFLESEELNRLFTVARRGGTQIDLRDRAILEVLFSTGLRVSEVSGLKIEQINLKRDEFTVKGKGSKPRVVFLSDEAKVAIKMYLKTRLDHSPFLFVSHDRAKGGRGNTGPLTPRSIQRIVDRFAREAGITKRISPHTLRHTYATDLLMAGADIRDVQSMLGHESITTTQIYTHITDKRMKDVHKKFHGKKRG